MGGQAQIYTTTRASPRETYGRVCGVGEFSGVMNASVRLGKWSVWREAKAGDEVSSVHRQLHSPPATRLDEIPNICSEDVWSCRMVTGRGRWWKERGKKKAMKI